MTDQRPRLPLPTRIGLGTLILASGSFWNAGHAAPATQDALDFPLGLLYGVAIGCLLLGFAARVRRNRSV